MSNFTETINYAQKIEIDLLLADRCQQTKFYTVTSIDVTAGNDPMGHQRVATITYYKMVRKVIMGNNVLLQLVQAKYQAKPQHLVPLLLWHKQLELVMLYTNLVSWLYLKN